MSWIEKIQSDYVITFSDGSEFRPNWLNAVKKIEYNIAEFDFPNVDGTLVKRGRPKGNKYGLEIYFQDEFHLDLTESFLASANDRRPWTITHPLYGNIIVQPTGLDIDNTNYNVTKITGTVIETITEDNPKSVVDPIDNIELDKENLDSLVIDSFDQTPSPADVSALTKTVNKLNAIGAKITQLAAEAQAYFELFQKANSAVKKATSAASSAMRAVQSLINAPALFTASVQDRMAALKDQFDTLNLQVSTITKKPSKKIFESNSINILSTMALASIKPLESDYKNRNDVIKVIDQLTTSYTSFVANMDVLQSDNGGEVDSYIPDANSMIALSTLFNNTISSLFTIALGAKQQRSFILTEDSNIIGLTHRFYTLDPSDANIAELMANNNFSLNELFQVRKGRTIVYYV